MYIIILVSILTSKVMKLIDLDYGSHYSANSNVVRESVELLHMNLLSHAQEGHIVHSNTE